MKYLSVSVLALTLAATNAMAEQHTSENTASESEPTDTQVSDGNEMMSMQGDLIRSRDIVGGVIYTFNEAQDEGWDPDYTYDAVGGDWNEIGEIEDLVLSKDGQLQGIVGEVGGFLDVADKHVMIQIDDVNLTALDDGTYAYVTRKSEEDLEAQEGIDEAFWN